MLFGDDRCVDSAIRYVRSTCDLPAPFSMTMVGGMLDCLHAARVVSIGDMRRVAQEMRTK